MGIVLIPEMTSNQLEAMVNYPEETTREDAYAKTDALMNRFLEIDGVGSIGIMSGNGTNLISSMAAVSEDDYLTYSIMITTENENAGKSEIDAIVSEMNKAASEILNDPENEFTVSITN